MFRNHQIALVSVILLTASADVSKAADLFGNSSGVTYWQGAYVGLHLGGGLGSAGSLTTGGTVMGAHGGYNFQADRFVIGGEIDYSASKLKNTSTNESFSQSWLSSVRARGGYTFGNMLTYGTFGIAHGPTE